MFDELTDKTKKLLDTLPSEPEADIMDLFKNPESKPEKPESKPESESKPLSPPKPESIQKTKPKQGNPDQKPDTRTNEPKHPIRTLRDRLSESDPDLLPIEDARQDFIHNGGSLRLKYFIKTLLANNPTPSAIEKIERFQREYKEFAKKLAEARAKIPFGMTIDNGENDINVFPNDWLIDDLLEKETAAIIFGLPKAGKSFVALDMAISLTMGRKFANRFNIDEPAKVWYFTNEATTNFQERMVAARLAFKPDKDARRRFVLFKSIPQLFKPKVRPNGVIHVVRKLEREINKKDYPDIVFIDTLRNATTAGNGNENDSGDMSVAIENAKRFIKAFGCAVVIVHHAGKNNALRGSSGISASVDLTVKVDKKSKHHVFSFTESRNIGGFPAQKFELDTTSRAQPIVKWITGKQVDDEQVDDPKQQVLKLLNENSGEWFTVKQISKQTGIADKTIYNLLPTLVKKFNVIEKLKDIKPSRYNPQSYSIQKSKQVSGE